MIDIFLRFAYATPIQLGYDPTVKRVRVGDEIQYEFTVDEKVFVTVGEPLSDFRADSVKGRSTRVFRVYEKGCSTEILYALKDLWIQDGGPFEGDFMQDILASVSAVCPTGVSYFLTTYVHGPVMLDAMTRDNSHYYIRQPPPTIQGFYLASPTIKASSITVLRGSLRSESVGYVPTPSKDQSHHASSQTWSYFPRTHYRHVFKEIGTTLHRLEVLQDIFKCLYNCVTGV